MRVLVTGAAGFLGSVVARMLVERGHHVCGFGRRASADATESVIGDIRDVDWLAEATHGCDAVVHLAALVEGKSPVDTFEINVRGTYCALEAAIAAGVGRFIYASSIAATGCLRPGFIPAYLPIDEAYPCTPASPYSVSKLIGEEMCAAAARRTGMTVIALRYASIAPVLEDDPWLALSRGGWRSKDAPASTQSATLWTGVSVQDAAVATVNALTASADAGSLLVVNIAAEEPTTLESPSVLADRFFPSVPRQAGGPDASGGTFFSIEQARVCLGFTPTHSFVAFAARHGLRLRAEEHGQSHSGSVSRD